MLAGGAIEEEVLRSVDDYEHAFHRFVDTHEKYLRFKDDEGMEAVAKESYEREIERKFLLDVDISEWKFNMKYEKKANAKSSRHSRRSSKTGEDSCSTRSSVKEERRIVVEARLRTEALEEKQSLERRLEEEEVEFKEENLNLRRKESEARLS